jgi:hypothetical protein
MNRRPGIDARERILKLKREALLRGRVVELAINEPKVERAVLAYARTPRTRR